MKMKSQLTLLCLHGKYQNSKVFQSKMNYLGLQKELKQTLNLNLNLIFLDAPNLIQPNIKLPHASKKPPPSPSKLAERCINRAWWLNESDKFADAPTSPSSSLVGESLHSKTQRSFDESVDYISDVIKSTEKSGCKVDGFIGFSQGGALAALLCSEGYRNMMNAWAPKLVIFCSAYLPDPDFSTTYSKDFNKDIHTLHIYGDHDKVIYPQDSEKLYDQFCQHGTKRNHTGGHNLNKDDLNHIIVDFFQQRRQALL